MRPLSFARARFGKVTVLLCALPPKMQMDDEGDVSHKKRVRSLAALTTSWEPFVTLNREPRTDAQRWLTQLPDPRDCALKSRRAWNNGTFLRRFSILAELEDRGYSRRSLQQRACSDRRLKQ